MLMTLYVFSFYKFSFDCIEGQYYKNKINSYGLYLSKRKQGRKISYISKKRICTNVTSHVHSSESNYTNTSNSANAIGYSNLLVSTFLPKIALLPLLLRKKKLIHSQVL